MKIISTKCISPDSSYEKTDTNDSMKHTSNMPDEWVIKNILNYSKALQVVNVSGMNKKIDIIIN